ncbi:MAG: low specificity L-threonine aldolase [Bacteroidales bacterium]|nr:low specificity L-threonine aldolase [Bacteroidales bacterium]
MKSFASDNWSGVCPEVMEALVKVNHGHIAAYGELDEAVTTAAIEKFKKYFGNDIAVFFVYNGTSANVLGTSHVIRSYQAIVAAHSAHMNDDECGAPEKISGSKILQLETEDGKIKPEQILPLLNSIGFQHHSQPKIISISQVTEKGTVYKPEEVKALAEFAHAHNMYLHMDGARISNAAVSLGMDFKSFTVDVGVDVLSFGGTKNGLMFGEAVVFLNKVLAADFEYTRKQGMQLHSKMRFISTQFDRYLTDELWKKNASHANKMAEMLSEKLQQFEQVIVTRKTEANGVFAIIPKEVLPKVQEEYFFHVWDVNTSEVRLMCSWDTAPEDIDGFVAALKKWVK